MAPRPPTTPPTMAPTGGPEERSGSGPGVGAAVMGPGSLVGVGGVFVGVVPEGRGLGVLDGRGGGVVLSLLLSLLLPVAVGWYQTSPVPAATAQPSRVLPLKTSSW